MLKLLPQNQKKKDVQVSVTSEALLRLKIDLDEIKNNEELMKFGTFTFPDENPYEFQVTLKPQKGSLWAGGTYPFKFIIPNEFPHNNGPSDKCVKRVRL